MSRWDIKLQSPLAPEATSTPLVQTTGSAAAILAGTPTKMGSSGYVVAMIDGDGTNGVAFAGLAKADSSETTAVDGRVTLWLPLPNMVYSGLAKTATNANTQAKIDALYGKRVVFDLTSVTWSVDTAATDSTNNSLIIVGGDYQTSTIYFLMNNRGTLLGS